ncbi:MAG: lysylphosphatidylglycerol synthase transmembrane domain-containing protein [Siphonobacter sp.]
MKYLKVLLKGILSLLALGWLYYKIDWEQTLPLLQRANWGWIIPAFLLFNASQLFSTLRMGQHLRPLQVTEPISFLVQLYYRAMFFNLFLPGGIGGDGYKVWLLQKRHQTGYKSFVSAMLLDRGSGLLAIVVLLLILAGRSSWIESQFHPVFGLDFAMVILVLAAGWGIYRFIFKKFASSFWPAIALSLTIQGTQVIVILLLLRAINVTELPLEYSLVFLLSSIASVIPLTLGGIGIRELVFLNAAHYLPIQADQSVLVSLLFFIINGISSLVGAFVSLPDQPKETDSPMTA